MKHEVRRTCCMNRFNQPEKDSITLIDVLIFAIAVPLVYIFACMFLTLGPPK